jgi:CBS domain-containing membrane protein
MREGRCCGRTGRHPPASVDIDLEEDDYQEIARERDGGSMLGNGIRLGAQCRPMGPQEGSMSHSDARVKEIMAKEVSTLGRNHTLDLADEIMSLERIRHLPVLDDGRVVGVVSQRDLFRSALATALGYGEKAQKRLLRTLRVKEVMREPAITVSPEATVKEATRLMLDNKIGCLPVVEGHTLVGIVTETDILRYVVSF